MKPQNIVCFHVVLIVAILITGCGGTSVPTERDARVVFENQLGNAFKSGIVKVVSFRKVNGQSGEESGVKFYNLEYEAEIEYPNGLNAHCSKTKFTGWDCWMKEIRAKGEKEKQKEQMTFHKTEKGWKGPDDNIY